MLMIVMVFFGIVVSNLPWLAGLNNLMLSVLFLMIGCIVALIGQFMIITRAMKTGADQLIDPGNPDKIIWFFIRRDDTVKIIPSVRKAQGLLEAKGMDAVVHDVKGYRLFDHNIRFVVEGTAHTADAKVALYCHYIKKKFGFRNLGEGREEIFKEIEDEIKRETRGNGGSIEPTTTNEPGSSEQHIQRGSFKDRLRRTGRAQY